MLIEEERVERKLLSRARGERCLTAGSSKQIGASRASDLRWSEGRALSDRSVFIEADWSKQSKRSSVERGERGISASACITSKPKTIAAERGKLQDKNIRYVVLDKRSRAKNGGEPANRAQQSRVRRLCAILLRMGPFLCALDSYLATCMVRGARGRHVCLSVVCTLVNNPKGRLSVLNARTHTHTQTYSLNVVCTLVNNPKGRLSVLNARTYTHTHKHTHSM